MPVSATRIFYISAFNADVEFLRISIDFVSRRIDRILLLTGNKVQVFNNTPRNISYEIIIIIIIIKKRTRTK